MPVQPAGSPLLTVARSAFPGWKGRKVAVEVQRRPKRLTSVWDGGSRDTFIAIRAPWAPAGTTVPSLPITSNPFSPNDQTYPGYPGIVLVEHSIFCGKDVGCHIYLHADDLEVARQHLGLETLGL